MFGGLEILVATIGTILVAGLRFARLSGPAAPLATVRRMLVPLPFIALLVLPLAGLDPATLALELGALRALASELGLVVLGMLLGGVFGGIGGCWMGLIAAPPTVNAGRQS
jgi:hypothetical protein